MIGVFFLFLQHVLFDFTRLVHQPFAQFIDLAAVKTVHPLEGDFGSVWNSLHAVGAGERGGVEGVGLGGAGGAGGAGAGEGLGAGVTSSKPLRSAFETQSALLLKPSVEAPTMRLFPA